MRRINKACLLLSISVVGLLVAGPGWSVSDGETSPSRDILIERLQGKVDVSTDGTASRVAIGDALALPSRIVTGDDGNILLRQGRTGVDIAPGSDVEIPEAAADGQLIARMIQHSGSAFYDVETRPLEQLKLTVETPYLVAVVKGTQFNVAVVDDTTTISLFEGTLEIRTPDGLQSIQLNAGEIAIRSDLDDSIRRLPMDADQLDEIARADGQDAADAAAGSPSRTDRTAAASDSAVVVGGGNASIPTGGIADGANSRVATAVRPTGGEVGKVAGDADIGGSPSLGVSNDVAVGSAIDVRATSGDVRVDTGIDASAGIGNSAIDIGAGVDTRVDLGGGRVELGLDAGLDTGVDLGGGDVDLGLDAGLDTGIDLGGAGLDTSLDLGLDANLSAGLDAGVDLGVDTAIDTGLGLGVDLGVDLAIDADSGLDLGLDLGLGGAGATGGTGSSGGTGGTGGGGLLGGLLGPLL